MYDTSRHTVGSGRRSRDGTPFESSDASGGVEPLLSARELADLLGFAAGTIVDWAERGDLPCFKLGGRLRFRESEALRWLEGRRLA